MLACIDTSSPKRSGHGLRERKKLQTRDALAAAAARLALERGLDALRVEDIAAAANVSARTFNNYFDSKYAALTARYVDRMRHAALALEERPDGEPLWEAIIEALLEQWGSYGRGHTQPDRATIAELRLIYGAPALQGDILADALSVGHPFTAAVAARVGADADGDLYPRLVTAVVTAATQAAIATFLAADPPVALVPLLRHALTEVAAGLPEPKRTDTA
nr:TetR family transcriptional regulator [Mycobacterium parmense]